MSNYKDEQIRLEKEIQDLEEELKDRDLKENVTREQLLVCSEHEQAPSMQEEDDSSFSTLLDEIYSARRESRVQSFVEEQARLSAKQMSRSKDISADQLPDLNHLESDDDSANEDDSFSQLFDESHATREISANPHVNMADRLIRYTIEYQQLRDQAARGEMRMTSYGPGVIFNVIKNQLEALSPEQKMHVFTIIEQLSSQADLEIEANGGSYDCKAGKIKKACNGIISIDKLIRGDEGAEVIN